MRLIPPPMSPRVRHGLAVASLTLAVSGCGGGGSPAELADDGLIDPTPVRLDQRITTRDVASGKGAARQALDLALATCNEWRAAVYELPANAPDAQLLDRLDVVERTRHLDPAHARAAVHSRWLMVELTDFPRWSAEWAAMVNNGETGYPANPPDCSLNRQTEHRNATIWRDGTRYDIDHTRQQVVERPGHADFTASTSNAALQRRTADKGTFLGEGCTWSRGLAGDAARSALCHWDRFPFQQLISWPWLLDGTVTLNGMQERTEAVSVSVPAALGAGSMFDLPNGYIVTTVPAGRQAQAD